MNNERMSQTLKRAIEAGIVTVNEKAETAVLRTGLVKAQAQTTEDNPNALAMATQKALGLWTELEMLGYRVEPEHTQVVLPTEDPAQGN